jgi:hypothetical protein
MDGWMQRNDVMIIARIVAVANIKKQRNDS